MNASLPITIDLQVFENLYDQNLANTLPPLKIESYNTFTQHSFIKLQLNERDMIMYLTNINKIKEVITPKGNLFTPSLDKLTYLILKYIQMELRS
jgi:hypothetical protein